MKNIIFSLLAFAWILGTYEPLKAGDSPVSSASNGVLKLYASSRVAPTESEGEKYIFQSLRWEPSKTAVVVCDAWDKHWCQAASERMAEMAPRIDAFLTEARRRGLLIVHAPSGCMEAYADHPARRAARNAPEAPLPEYLKMPCAGLDAEKKAARSVVKPNGDCSCAAPCKRGAPQSRQIGSIKIAETDAVSDSGIEIGNLFAQRGIENVMVLGLYDDPGVLGRPFGLRNLKRWGKNVVLVRDLTDASFNPGKTLGTSRERGMELAVEHVERCICPTISSGDLLGGPAFRFKADKRPHVALIASDDEYFSEETFPAFAQLLRERYGCYCTPLVSDKGVADIPALDELQTADLMMLFVRRRALPAEQLGKIRAYLDAGKPLVALRTSSHAFSTVDGKPPAAGFVEWKEFDHDVLGGNYHSYVKTVRESEIEVVPEAAGHPILKGVEPAKWQCTFPLYFVSPLAADATVLLRGHADGKTEPVGWTHSYKGNRTFYASLGCKHDFESVPQFRTILVNAVFWAMDRPVPEGK